MRRTRLHYICSMRQAEPCLATPCQCDYPVHIRRRRSQGDEPCHVGSCTCQDTATLRIRTSPCDNPCHSISRRANTADRNMPVRCDGPFWVRSTPASATSHSSPTRADATIRTGPYQANATSPIRPRPIHATSPAPLRHIAPLQPTEPGRPKPLRRSTSSQVDSLGVAVSLPYRSEGRSVIYALTTIRHANPCRVRW